MTKTKRLPVLRGTVVLMKALDGFSYPVIQCWCPHCREFHCHGWDSADTGKATHRVAHCTNPDSPFKDGGYMVAEWRETDPEGKQ